MAKKQLDVTGMINELRGQSVFFQKQPASGSLEANKSQPEKKTKSKSDPRYHDTMVPSNRDTTVSRYHDTKSPQFLDDADIDKVVAAVQETGRAPATYRFTQAEKDGLRSVVFNLRGDGIRTSENELLRIAINLIVLSQEYGEDGFFREVLKRLQQPKKQP